MRRHIAILVSILLLGGILRSLNLGHIPAALYWDEVAIGLDAYSLSTWGVDINGFPWLQPMFGSYGDFKAPVYIWFATPFVWLFGLEPAMIRLPSAIMSIFSIGLMYWLVVELFKLNLKNSTHARALGLLAAFITAIIPWSSHFGRIGFESSLSLGIVLLSFVLMLKAIVSKKPYWLIGSSLVAVLGVYTYYPLRVLYPIWFILLMFTWRKTITPKLWLTSLACVVLFGLALVPLYTSPYFARSEQYRQSDNTLLSNPKPILESSKFLEQYDSALWARLVYHRTWFYLKDFMTKYLSHLDPRFIFFSGDSELRQHTGVGGMLFPALVVPAFLGILAGFKKSKHLYQLAIVLLLTYAIPASVKYEPPNASRAIYGVIPWIMFASMGLQWMWQSWRVWWKSSWLSLFMIAWLIWFAANALQYWTDYFTSYNSRSSQAWVMPYQIAAEFIAGNYLHFQSIELTEAYWNPPVYIAFAKPELLLEMRDLKRAMLNDPVTSFGFPYWFNYLNQSNPALPHATLMPPGSQMSPEWTMSTVLYDQWNRGVLEVWIK